MEVTVSSMQQLVVRILTLCFLNIFGNSYKLECPRAGHWKLRAIGYCSSTNDTDKYFCLLDVLKDEYTEGCRGPDWDRKGSKRIISGDFTRGNCARYRYQPFDFWTNGNSECVYNKTVCAEEGQVISSNGSGYQDRTCRCDFARGYNYTQPPADLCSCDPSVEDCSCVREECCDFHEIEALDRKIAIVNIDDQGVLTQTVPNMQNFQVSTGRRDGRIVVTAMLCITIASLTCIIWIWLVDSFCETVGIHSSVDLLDGTRPETVVKEEKAFKKDEINYLRIVHLIFRVACPVVRMVFNEEMNPELLGKTLFQNTGLLNDKFRRSDRWTKMFPRLKRINEEERSSTNGKQTINGQTDSMLPKNGETTSRKTKEIYYNISSDSFDIKCMINLLKDFEIFGIGDRLPLPNDTKTDALLGRIQYYRTVIVDAVDGRLSDKDFQLYWKEIGQGVLRMASKHLNEINRKKALKVLRDQLVVLSPIKEDDIMLQRFVLLTERFPQLIFEQLIKEYCLETFNDESSIPFLQAEKHNLLHKRKKQSYCCYCDNTTFSHNISDELWKTLYSYNDTKKLSHTCKRIEKCVLRYEVNSNFQIDKVYTAVLIPLVLNTPQLLRYVVTKMFKKSLQPFLEKSKHVIFHAVESFDNIQCCHCKDGRYLKVKTLLTPPEWEKLYTKKKQTICTAEQCCCGFSVIDSLSTNSLDDVLLFKIMSITGPFHVFHETQFNPFKTFLYWDCKCNEYIDAINELLKAVKDAEFVQKIKCKLASSESSFGGIEQGYVAKWILKNKSVEKATSSQKSNFVVILQDGGKLATQEVAVPYKADICLSGKDKIPWTLEETNFLRLYHMLIQIVYPAVKVEFDKHISGHLENIITDIYYKDIQEEYQTEDNLKYALQEPLRLSSYQRNRIFLTKQDKDLATSEDLDLALMIRILEENRNDIKSLKDDVILYICLETVKDIRKIITQSCNGILTNDEFDKYWDILSEVAIYLGGEGYEQRLLDLKTHHISQGDE